jgi:hypothetical protein
LDPTQPDGTERLVTFSDPAKEAAMKKWLRLFMGVLIVLALGVTTAPTAQAATAPYCGIWWGSLAKSGVGPSYPSSSDWVYNVRTGRHTCYDRLVVDVSGPVGTYHVQYVSQILTEGRGLPVPTRGGAALQISVMNPGYDPNTGTQTYVYANANELTNVTGYRTFRQVVWAGTYEGYSSVGIGVRARLPFRVFVLTGPGSSSRLVVDVAHRW